ncbi:hypothetical protein [uncultured Parasphingorhabdus sp.]|uniref:hypothetical protein n=1 Tax=uncultured Parasphingorhabdus sp. TaxID=2709694 RepID=UPI0030D88180|tara:strand:- start:10830 stop:11600 length:771 start_codon:yes stop_codon:yes gene_type:complete
MKALAACLSVLLLGLTGCGPQPLASPPEGAAIITVVGALHGQHRSSEDYSLDVLRQAIVKFDPDIVMVELPPDRFGIASANFDQFGEVRESRADNFPELTDVVFPLRKDLGFEMIPVAAWTAEIAAERSAVEKRLAADPGRAEDWSEYQAAIQQYGKALAGRSDDPAFIHSGAYDAAVKARQKTYERLFGDDLGSGGWRAINAAHLANINNALDRVKGQEKRVLILFGAAHKYKILEGLEAREDVFLAEPAVLFGE